mmetsp:Transcript_83478/g.235355  ORF Transcript_83478/g.235355 Transcript_83478/m.235355 type:complete len:411 (+) Transcript_83478:222-1454(+)
MGHLPDVYNLQRRNPTPDIFRAQPGVVEPNHFANNTKMAARDASGIDGSSPSSSATSTTYPKPRRIMWDELTNVSLINHGSGTSVFSALLGGTVYSYPWSRPRERWPARGPCPRSLIHRAHPLQSPPPSPAGVAVAVKAPKHGLSAVHVAEVTDELKHESHILARLRHPNIIRFFGCGSVLVGDAHNIFFIVVELLGGGTLSDMTKPTSARPGLNSYCEILDHALSLARALEYLHQAADPTLMTIHRDLKPDNIGFDQAGNLKLFDFGLAAQVPREVEEYSNDEVGTGGGGRRLPRYRLTGQTGSVRYMAPEVSRHGTTAKPHGRTAARLHAATDPHTRTLTEPHHLPSTHRSGGTEPAVQRDGRYVLVLNGLVGDAPQTEAVRGYERRHAQTGRLSRWSAARNRQLATT